LFLTIYPEMPPLIRFSVTGRKKKKRRRNWQK
jgi:hypothetical protein